MTKSVNFDRAVEFYDATRGFPPGVDEHIPPLFLRAGNLTADSRVLEIGVGTGRIALPVAPQVGWYAGIDISTGMMGKLRAKQISQPIHLLQGDATRLPFRSASLDAVIAVHIFHLIPGWRIALEEVKRVLKPGGALLSGWNHRDTSDSLQSVWEEAIGRTRETSGAMPVEKRATFLADSGWVTHGDEQAYHYTVYQSAQEFITHVRERTWSHLWQMTDEQIAAGLVVIEPYMRDHYPDPSAPIALDASFKVQAYLPPA